MPPSPLRFLAGKRRSALSHVIRTLRGPVAGLKWCLTGRQLTFWDVQVRWRITT